MDLLSTYIVDFQYLCGNATNEYFISELAISQLSTLKIKTYNFKPPFSEKHLTNDKSKKTNHFLNKTFNINWNFGKINYLKLDEILKKLNNQTIFVKGERKRIILEKYLSKNTIVKNLENLYVDIPNLKALRKFNIKCRNHLTFENCICAHENVFNLLVYFLNKM
jgi:hypothetical protein